MNFSKWELFSGSPGMLPQGGGGDLVVQGDVNVAKFRVSKSAIYYLLGSKNVQIYYRLGL